LNWIGNGTSYDVYRDGTLLSSGITQSSFKNNGTNLAGQTHNYFIRARNSSTTTTDASTISVTVPSDICTANTPPMVLLKPGLKLPLNGASLDNTINTVTLTWGQVAGAAAYRVVIKDMTTGVVDTSIPLITGSSRDVAVAQGHAYAWAVTSCLANTSYSAPNCPDSSSASSFGFSIQAGAVDAFTISPADVKCDTTPPTASLFAPAVSLVWTRSNGGATYEIFRDDSRIGVTSGTTFYDHINVAAGQSYQYKVVATNSVGSLSSNTIAVNVPALICESGAAALRTDIPEDSSIAPTPANKAVVITHGRNDTASTWVNEMAQAICNKLVAPASNPSFPATIASNYMTKICQVKGWDVWVIDWSDSAHTLTPLTAPDSWANAISKGEAAANNLKTKDYSHIHFIAHSAGSNLIENAAVNLLDLVALENRPPVSIHETFLDPYDPSAATSSYGMGRHVSNYGKRANWADNYVDTRLVGVRLTGLDFTDLHLGNGFNFNVTPTYDGCEDNYILSSICSHNRPYRFYGLSIDPNYIGNADDKGFDPIATTAGMGFVLSVENGIQLSTLQNGYPKAGECLAGDTVCYSLGSPTSAFTFFPNDLKETVVDAAVGTTNFVGGAGVKLFDLIQLGTGWLSGTVNSQSTVLSSAQMSASATSTATVESPSWLVVTSNTTQPTNLLRFDWRFAEAGEGVLRVFVDGNLVREIDQRNVPTTSLTTEEVYVGGDAGTLPPENHRIAFRLDGFGATASGVELTNVELGLVTANTAPDAPIALSATAENGLITVNFSAPTNDGGAAITGYTVISSPAGGVDSNSGSTELSHVITGLANGTAYTFTVIATNSVGTSPASVASNSVKLTAPIDWLDTYVRSSRSQAGDYGLDNYDLSVGGWGDVYYSYIQFDMAGQPDSVTSVRLRLYVTSAEAGEWTYPNMTLWTNGGAWVEGMPWQNQPGSAQYVRDISKPIGVGWFDIDITDIYKQWKSGAVANYGIHLRPTTSNANMVSFASSESIDITQRPMLVIDVAATVPSSPTAVSASAGDGYAVVSFTAPVTDGGSAVTGYTITSSPGGLTATGTASPITVTGLSNGTTYTFAVTANNSVGTSDASLNSNSVVPVGSQSITFASVQAIVVTGSAVLNATGGASGNQVTFNSATPSVCSVSGNTVTGILIGICTVTANQDGNASYAAAGPVSQDINVIADKMQMTFAPGWNLLGNSWGQTFSVVPMFSDTATVTTVWKWDAANSGWQFYAPSMDANTLQTYAAGKGYGVLNEINPGEGYWINAKAPVTLSVQPSASFNLTASHLTAGWNLVATGNNVTPSAFNSSLSETPPSQGIIPINLITLWAWDATMSQWYFYAPSLEANGGLGDYTAGKGYLDFGATGKTLGNGVGFWVNKP